MTKKADAADRPVTSALLLLDRARSVVHRRDCPGLLAVQTPAFEPFVGMERALTGELKSCMCCQALIFACRIQTPGCSRRG